MKTRSTLASHSLEGWGTKSTKMVYWIYQFLNSYTGLFHTLLSVLCTLLNTVVSESQNNLAPYSSLS